MNHIAGVALPEPVESAAFTAYPFITDRVKPGMPVAACTSVSGTLPALFGKGHRFRCYLNARDGRTQLDDG